MIIGLILRIVAIYLLYQGDILVVKVFIGLLIVLDFITSWKILKLKEKKE